MTSKKWRRSFQTSIQLSGSDQTSLYIGCHGPYNNTMSSWWLSVRDPRIRGHWCFGIIKNPQLGAKYTTTPSRWSGSLCQTTCWESSEAQNQTWGKSGRVLVLPGWMDIIQTVLWHHRRDSNEGPTPGSILQDHRLAWLYVTSLKKNVVWRLEFNLKFKPWFVSPQTKYTPWFVCLRPSQRHSHLAENAHKLKQKMHRGKSTPWFGPAKLG